MLRKTLFRTISVGVGNTGRREMGLNSKYIPGKWDFLAKEHKDVSGWKITKREHGYKRGSG